MECLRLLGRPLPLLLLQVLRCVLPGACSVLLASQQPAAWGTWVGEGPCPAAWVRLCPAGWIAALCVVRLPPLLLALVGMCVCSCEQRHAAPAAPSLQQEASSHVSKQECGYECRWHRGWVLFWWGSKAEQMRGSQCEKYSLLTYQCTLASYQSKRCAFHGPSHLLGREQSDVTTDRVSVASCPVYFATGALQMPFQPHSAVWSVLPRNRAGSGVYCGPQS